MTLLSQRFNRLSALPHLPLSESTPVRRLDDLSKETGGDLWVKADDQSASLYGGNKVRKLEFLLGDARRRGAHALITTGAYGSHHVLATSLFGNRWHFDVHAVLVPQPWTDHAQENLRCTMGAGTTIHPVRAWPLVAPKTAALMASLTARGKAPYWVPHGGSSVVGTLGYVEAGLELATQIDSGELPEPEAIYVALGSGGTAAGLAIGLSAAGLTMPVVGVRVTPRMACNRATMTKLIRGVVRHLRQIDAGFPDVARGALRNLRIEGDYYGGGYGVVDARTDSALRRGRRAGLTLDPTYTAKAFAAFVRGATGEHHGGPLLFWNTLSSADLAGQLEGAPPVPDTLLRAS